MSSKRTLPFRDEIQHRSLVPKTKRPRLFSNAVRLVMDDLFMDRLIAKLEPAIRRSVSEAVERAIINHVHPSPSLRILSAPDMIYRLRFQDPLSKSKTIFIGKKISVRVMVVNADSDAIVTSDPLRSISVELVVLHGHFGGNGQNEWTEEEFNRDVVTGREGRGPLLMGKTVIKLVNGVGVLNAWFTDNSSWTRSKMFRLGARVVPGQNIHGIVLEEISEAFPVRDSRGEPCQKYHPPLYSDEVFRLENIWRGGVYHKRLEGMGVTTVEAFVLLLKADELRFRSVLGKRMTKKSWEATVKHALESVPGCELYSYSDAASEVDILFDSNSQFVGANFEGNYIPCDHLNSSQQDKVTSLWKLAAENPNEMQLFRRTTGSSIPGSSTRLTGSLQIGSSEPQPEYQNFPTYYHGSGEEPPQPQPYGVQTGLTGELNQQNELLNVQNNEDVPDSYPPNAGPSTDPYQRNERWSPCRFDDNFLCDLDVLLDEDWYVQIKKRKWVRLFSLFKCKSVFSKMLAAKRAGIIHLTLPEVAA